ncbi:unnamed protein product, partial [Rangifer tarandus platyrhynchus]
VTVDILDKSDEAPLWTPSVCQAVIFDNVVAGTNVNGFQLNCHDRNSQVLKCALRRFLQRKVLTIVYTAINTYKSSDWYIPLVLSLMAIFFAGLVSWICFLLWRYGNATRCSQKMAKEVSVTKPIEIKYMAGDRNQKEIVVTGNRNKKLEVLTETIVYETVFNREAVDPVSGNVYEYDSRTGVKKWKKPPQAPGGGLGKHILPPRGPSF